MLSHADLVNLLRTLGERTVLSVYINGEERDPAKRRRWRVDLRNSLNDIETWLEGASHSDREAFAASRRALLERFDATRGLLRAPGWAGFFTSDGEVRAGPVPAPVPTMAVWSSGPCLTPYVRALKEARPVFVVIIDARKARIFRYAERKADLVETVRAATVVEHPSHMSAPPRPGFHSGTRGTTGADAAQRELREGTAHLLSDVVSKLSRLAGDAAWIAVGGIPAVAKALMSRLPSELAPRVTHAEHVDVHVSKAEVAEVARQAASTLRDAQDLERISDVLASADRNGLGATGSVDTSRALEQGRAREVFFTQRFLEDHAADAERIVRAALGTDAPVEHVSGAAAARLDEVGGVAAQLRYAPMGSDSIEFVRRA